MRKSFFLFFVFSAVVPSLVFADSNNIAELIFTTIPQTVASNTLSSAITVGTVNGAGDSEKVTETNDVTLTTTSQTGQFLNSSGSPVSTTMSTNTATRTFYYEDSTPGTYTLTVSIKGRTSGKQFSASQQIIVGTSDTNSDSSSNSSDNSNATSTGSSDDSSDSGSSGSSSSNVNNSQSHAYSSQVPVYIGPDQEPFNMSIGRDRITTVGTPVSFEAKIIPDTASYNGIVYSWSFGDGTSWDGSSPTHTYMYPGDYIVILNSSRYGNEAVSEAHIKVLAPEVSMSSDENFVTISNQSDYELNIGGWAIVAGKIRFVIPKDTIIAAHSETHISRDVMKNEDTSLTMALFNPSSDQVASADVTTSSLAANNDLTAFAYSSTTSVRLPDGMSMDDFSVRFKEEFSKEMAKAHLQDADVADGSPENSYAQASQTPDVADTNALPETASTSEAADVIYSIPHDSSAAVLSGVSSWFARLFGKQR